MYGPHFGLTEAPFSITPTLRYFYMSEKHREGLAHLLYGIRQPGGFVQLTGEVGTGKTSLCRCLLQQLPPEADVALILNPRVTALEFLASVCDELRIAYPPDTGSIKVLVDAIYRHLLDAHARGRRTVLLVDEAQNLSPLVLEQIRLLTNLETTAEKLLQIILIGQPELIRLLRRPRLRQLDQRITARYHLRELSRQETCGYIAHRLQVAGGSGTLFTPMAMRLVHRLSGGLPRLINIICDRALLGAYAHDRRRVTAAIVRRAGKEVRGSAPPGRLLTRLGRASGLSALGAVVAGAVLLVTASQLSLPRSDAPPSASPGLTLEVSARSGTAGARADQSGNRTEGVTTGLLPDRQPSAPSRLVDLLAEPSIPADDRTAFAGLFALWGMADHEADASLGCGAGSTVGLECLVRSGAWMRVRRYDRPTILELTLATGQRHRVLLVGLGDGRATLRFGSRDYTFPLGEIDDLWDGSFIVPWKVPAAVSRVLWLGMRGEDVAWLRQRLDGIENKAPDGLRHDVFDATLRQRVLAFQRSWSLTPDGVVGRETLAHLVLAAREPGSPSLSPRAP
jgi:general secretion pathway protein A